MTQLIPIKSSMFTGHAYDPDTQRLTIEFTNGTRGVYEDVSADKVASMLASESPGGYFAAHIRNAHRFTPS